MKASNHLSNVLVIFIDNEAIHFNCGKAKEKLESKISKGVVSKQTEANKVINTLRRFFQVSRSVECSPQELAEDLASKAKLFKSIAKRGLLHELEQYRIKLKENKPKLSENKLLSELKAGQFNDFWTTFPLLKLYFTFHTRLMTMEKPLALTKIVKAGLSTFSDVCLDHFLWLIGRTLDVKG